MSSLLRQYENSQNSSFQIGTVIEGVYYIKEKYKNSKRRYRVFKNEDKKFTADVISNNTKNSNCRRHHSIAGNGDKVRALIVGFEGGRYSVEIIGKA